MAMVSSYFAHVGVQLDNRSLRSVQAYFKNIERTMVNFQRRAGKAQTLDLKFRIDRRSLRRQMNVAMRGIGRQAVVPLNNFRVNRGSLQKALRKVSPTNSATGGVSIGLRVDRNSLSRMRDQVRQALEGTTIRPRISPRMMRGTIGGYGGIGGSRGTAGGSTGGTHLDPRNTRRQSPWHNPMMIGGGTGAFMRYGFYSLPFIGGVMGLGAMSNTIQEFRAQETGLSFAAGMVDDPSKGVGYYKNYLQSVGERTGIRESMLSRDFHQMLAGSAGTDMEPHLEEGFLGLTQYAAILGLSEESMKLVMKGGHTPYVVATLH